jgi:PAS domain S-box-containing protein
MAEERPPLDQELFFQSSDDPCFVLEVALGTQRFTVAAINPAFEALTGLRAAEIVGHSPSELFPPEVKSLFEGRLVHAATAGETSDYVEEIRFPIGVRIWRTRVVPARGADGTIRWLLGFGYDVTDARHAAASLAASERRYRALLEALQGGVWQIDRDGVTTFVNPRMAEMLGYDAREMIGRRLLDFCEGEWADFARAEMKERAVGAHGSYEFEFKGQDGRRVRTLVSTAPQFDDDGHYAGAVGSVHDITDRLHAEEERATLERKLQETQKLESLGVLAGGIAHDFNNLLTGILGSTSLARMDLPAAAPAQEHITQIEAAARRAADLCRQMLAYAGKGRFVVQNLDLTQLVRETTQLLELSISKKASLRYELAASLPLVSVDATQIRQILMNLVLNASEALGDRPGTLLLATGTQVVDTEYVKRSEIEGDMSAGRYVYLEVSDSGCGMSRETLERIFDPFFTTKFTGRGLGLSAVLGIVRGHKGAIKVYSEVGKGTTFKTFFPVAPGGAAHKLGASSMDEWRGQGAVLVIDDEPAVRSITERILRALGFEALSAGDGRQGLEIVGREGLPLVAVLMDLTMPNMDGETAFREIRLVRPNLPIVLMSGYNEQDAIARFAGKGLAGFLQKPFTVDGLRHALRVVLAPGVVTEAGSRAV